MRSRERPQGNTNEKNGTGNLQVDPDVLERNGNGEGARR